jgi:phospholipase C
VGEKLIADVYNAIRNSKYWKQSLLIITYDEHGGCYDHVPPPKAVSPDGLGPPGFPFNAFGVRVPAVIISPYMPEGSVVRSAPAGTAYGAPPYPFDHTSISATLHELFGMPGSLTRRDAAAPSLLSALTLPLPTNDGPSSVVAPEPDVSKNDVRQTCKAPPSHHQDLLSRMSRALPIQPGVDQGAVAAQPIPETGFETVLEAGVHAVARVKMFLGL